MKLRHTHTLQSYRCCRANMSTKLSELCLTRRLIEWRSRSYKRTEHKPDEQQVASNGRLDVSSIRYDIFVEDCILRLTST